VCPARCVSARPFPETDAVTFCSQDPRHRALFQLMSLDRVKVHMSDQPYYAILTMVFATEGDIRIWRDKLETFSTPEAVSYLKSQGQKSLRIVETRENGVIKACCIWEYENAKAREACQIYWSKWFEFEGAFVAKGGWLRGEETFAW